MPAVMDGVAGPIMGFVQSGQLRVLAAAIQRRCEPFQSP
jgi:hypothetical protein